MPVSENIRKEIIAQQQGALRLQIAFIGISSGLLEAFYRTGAASADEIARVAGLEVGYVARWCDAAYAFELLDELEGKFLLSERGQAFRPDEPGTLMPMAVGAVLSAHMAERAAGLMHSGERPGEVVLGERPTILPWFGPMLEKSFGALFEGQILPALEEFRDVDARGGLVVDLGCGNGWYLRILARRFTRLRGIGLDGFAENIRQGVTRAQQDGVGDRLDFRVGDIYQFNIDDRADLIAMNRALHHVWNEKEKVFAILRDHLKPGGVAVIWEPNWPRARADLREPQRRAMAFQNLAEHVQGNHFLTPEEISAQFRAVGMEAKVYLFVNGNEAVVVGRRTA